MVICVTEQWHESNLGHAKKLKKVGTIESSDCPTKCSYFAMRFLPDIGDWYLIEMELEFFHICCNS